MSTPPPRRGAHGPLRWIGPLLLVAGSAWPAPLITLYDVTVTGDRLLGLVALAGLAYLGVRRELRWTSVHTALAIFVGVQVVTTVLHAAVWPRGLRYVAVYVLGFACFALAVEWARGVDGQRRMAWVWIAVGTLVSVVGSLASVLANVYQRDVWGARMAHTVFEQTEHERRLYAATVTFGEWNPLSSFVLIPFALALWAWRRDGGNQRGLIPVVAAMLLGLGAGITRAAWISTAGIIAAWCVLRSPRRRRVAELGLILAAVVLLQATALGGTALHSRLVGLWTLSARTAIAQATIASWLERPLLGHGAGSSNFLVVDLPGLAPTEKIWNSNLVLFILRDSGVLGLTAFLAVLVLILRRAAHGLRRDRGRATSSLAVPLIVGGIALAFCYQFSHALWLMYPYVYLGFLTAAIEPGHDEAGLKS